MFCKYCGDKLQGKTALNNHEKECIKNKEKLKYCTFCGDKLTEGHNNKICFKRNRYSVDGIKKFNAAN